MVTLFPVIKKPNVLFILIILLFGLSGCLASKKASDYKYQSLIQSISKVWVADTCGYNVGDRRAVANILNRYTNKAQNLIDIKEINGILGPPDEIRNEFPGKESHYYFITAGKCNPSKLEQHGFVLRMNVDPKSKLISGSAVHILEPEDN